MSETATAHDFAALRARVTVVDPSETGWDEARRGWNLASDQMPVAVAFPATADQVAAVVDFARANGLRVAPQATGHFAGTLAPLDDAILVKTERMRGVTIDPDARRARVEAGAQWADVAVPAASHGLAGLAGTAPDVGVVGYTLGGGLGWLARRYGLAANSVLAAEVVTADGQLRRVDRERESELFWALRGGGGSFGVVTALEFSLYPVAELYAGDLLWPVERASEILHAWRDWVETVPRELTSVGRLLHLPPIPDIPEPLRGRSFVLVEAAYIGSEDDGRELLRPLREREPELDTFAMIPAPGLAALHMDPPAPVPAAGDGGLLSALPAEAVDGVVQAAGPESGTVLLSVELRHLGGALAEPSPEHGAVGEIDAAFAHFSVGLAMTPDVAAAVRHEVERVLGVLAPWEAGRTYFNFTERRVESNGLFPEETVRRLAAIKRQVDPDNIFLACHPVAPA